MTQRLTDKQTARLLQAYRETFRSDNHGDAISAMYSKFEASFGVSGAVLRDAVILERQENPKLYRKLQRELIQRQALTPQPGKNTKLSNVERSKAAQRTAKRKDKSGTEKAEDGRTFAKCAQCKRSVEVDSNTGRFVQHRYLRDSGWHCPKSGSAPVVPGPEQKAGKRRCPICSKWVIPKLDGSLRSHKKSTGAQCAGSGRPPAEGAQAGKKGRRAGSVYTVSGGLPGLGKAQ